MTSDNFEIITVTNSGSLTAVAAGATNQYSVTAELTNKKCIGVVGFVVTENDLLITRIVPNSAGNVTFRLYNKSASAITPSTVTFHLLTVST